MQTLLAFLSDDPLTYASTLKGTDFTIAVGSFDTSIPSNINDADIDPSSQQAPVECGEVTDSSFSRICARVADISRQITHASRGVINIGRQTDLTNEISKAHHEEYLRYATQPGDPIRSSVLATARLIMGKMTLLGLLPVLFSSSDAALSANIRDRLLIAAIEVAEFNHELNNNIATQKWRWLYQSHTHWYAITYLMIECNRRPWLPTVERAWLALHSKWLIPANAETSQIGRVWFPLRKLMTKARQHRARELDRLRRDHSAVVDMELDDKMLPRPTSSGSLLQPDPEGRIVRERWRQLVMSAVNLENDHTPQTESERSEHFGISPDSGTIHWREAYNTHDRTRMAQMTRDTVATTHKNHAISSEPTVADNLMEVTELSDTFARESNDHHDGQRPELVQWLWADHRAESSPSNTSHEPIMPDAGGDMEWLDWSQPAHRL